MAKFVIKKGELAARQEQETPAAPQAAGTPKFVIHKKEQAQQEKIKVIIELEAWLRPTLLGGGSSIH